MGWMPGAVVRDVGAPANYSNGRMRSYRGVVLHVNAANSGDLYGWITGNGQMSCHWQVLKDGTVYQYIDTLYSSWCQEAGNDDWLSIETSGFPNEPLTDAALASCARIMAYAHSEHGIPLTLADTPAQVGLGWHGMGGQAWGNHPGCPGDLRKRQRAAILTAAARRLTPNSLTPTPLNPSEEDDMYELWQVAKGTKNEGRVYAVRAGSLPIWLSPTDLETLKRFGKVTNPEKFQPVLQVEIDRLTVAVKKGMVA